MKGLNLSFIQKSSIFLLILARIIVPFSIFYNPLLGILLCIFLDTIDYGVLFFLNIPVDRKPLEGVYQRVDKTLDMYHQSMLFIFIATHFNEEAVFVATVLYLYRFTGYTLFLTTMKRYYFIIFENIFENFGIVLLILVSSYEASWTLLSVTLMVAVITKLPQEVIVHSALNRYPIMLVMFVYNAIRSRFGLAPKEHKLP